MSEAEKRVERRLPGRRLTLGVTAGCMAAAAVILFVGILPAEFNRDPTGLGKLTGISRLWAPAEQVIPATGNSGISSPLAALKTNRAAFRSDVIDIRLGASTIDSDGMEAVEYKVRLDQDASFVYSWQVTGIADPEEFYTEFHGHTVAAGKVMTVTYYRKASGQSDSGTLTAPFAGLHGWYFQNQSAKPVTVKLRISGFYTLILGGQPGNEAGILAKPASAS